MSARIGSVGSIACEGVHSGERACGRTGVRVGTRAAVLPCWKARRVSAPLRRSVRRRRVPQLFGGIFTPAAGYSDVPCPGGVCPNPELEPLPRQHFDYFFPAVLTVFVITTGEWVDAMDPGASVAGPPAAFFYATVLLFGRFLLINLLGVRPMSFPRDLSPSSLLCSRSVCSPPLEQSRLCSMPSPRPNPQQSSKRHPRPRRALWRQRAPTRPSPIRRHKSCRTRAGAPASARRSSRRNRQAAAPRRRARCPAARACESQSSLRCGHTDLIFAAPTPFTLSPHLLSPHPLSCTGAPLVACANGATCRRHMRLLRRHEWAARAVPPPRHRSRLRRRRHHWHRCLVHLPCDGLAALARERRAQRRRRRVLAQIRRHVRVAVVLRRRVSDQGAPPERPPHRTRRPDASHA
jgi:hypothetical protein